MPASPTRLASNSRWNLLGFGFTLLAQFITVPFVIDRIGVAAFGQAGLVIAAWAPLLLVGTVLGQALTREMAERLGAADADAAARVAATALALAVISCAGLGLVFAGLGPWLLALLTGEPTPQPGSHVWFAIAGVGWAAQQGMLVLQAISVAQQDFRTTARVSAFAALGTIVATLGCTAAWPGVAGYLSGVSASFAIGLAAWWVALRADRRRLGIGWGTSREAVAALLRFGKWQMLAQTAGTVSNQIDRYLLAALAPLTVVGQYNAANRLQEAVYVGVMKGAEVLFPHFGATATQEPSRRARFYVLASWVVMGFSAVVLAPLIPLAEPTLRLWAGPEVADGGAVLLQLLVLGGLIGAGSNVFTYYLMGTGQTSTVAGVSLVYSLLTIVLSWILLLRLGPYAAGGGLALASVVRVALGLWLLKSRHFRELPVGELLVSTVLPLLAGATVAAAATAWGWPPLEGWIGLGLSYGVLAGAVALCVLATTALSGFGRTLIAAAWRVRPGRAVGDAP